MEKLRVTIVGCGDHMSHRLAPHLKSSPSLRVVRCIDSDLPKATTLAKSFDCASAQVLNFDDIEDAIISALPPEESLTLIKQCISRKVPLFVEKPAAFKSISLANVLKFHRGHPFIQVGFNYRHSDAVKAFRAELLDREHKLDFVDITFFSRHPLKSVWGATTRVEGWYRFNSIHLFDIVQTIFGNITNHRILSHFEVNENFRTILNLQTDASSHITASCGNHCDRFTFEVRAHFSDSRVLELRSLTEVTLHVRSGSETLYRRGPFDDGRTATGYGAQFEYFAEHCKGSSLYDLISARDHLDLAERIIDGLPISL